MGKARKPANRIRTTTYVTLAPDVHARVKRLAQQEDRPMSAVIQEAIEAYFEGGFDALIEKKRRLRKEALEASGQQVIADWFLRLSPAVRMRVVEIGEALREFEERHGELRSGGVISSLGGRQSSSR